MDTIGAGFIDTKHPQSAPSGAGTPFLLKICSPAMDTSDQREICAPPLINISVLVPILILKITGNLSWIYPRLLKNLKIFKFSKDLKILYAVGALPLGDREVSGPLGVYVIPP